MTRDGDTSSLVLPPGPASLIIPGYSTKAVSTLITFLTTGVITVDLPLLEEVAELAKVLELRQEMGAGQLEVARREVVAEYRQEEERVEECRQEEERGIEERGVERQVEQGAEEPEEEVEHSQVGDPKEATVYPIATYPLNTFSCLECNKNFVEKKKLKKHELALHLYPTSCRLCHKTFPSLELFKRHEARVHNPPSHFCYICDKGFRRADHLQRHKETHEPAGNSVCRLCQKVFARPENLARHHRVVHGHQQASKRILNKYITKVRERSRWTCARCNVTFASRAIFKVHMKKQHGGEVSLIHGAGEAGGKFVMVDDGRARGEEHMLPCSHCNFVFNSHKQLETHKQVVHKGEKTHFCHQCEKGFKSKMSLQQHKRRIHGGLIFSCDRCAKKLSTSASLKKHKLGCGKPKVLKPFHELSRWGKGHRAKATARDLINTLEGMGEEERRKTLVVVAKDKPHLLDHLTTNPFTIADILSVSLL